MVNPERLPAVLHAMRQLLGDPKQMPWEVLDAEHVLAGMAGRIDVWDEGDARLIVYAVNALPALIEHAEDW